MSFFTVIKLLPHKSSEWLSLVPDSEAKSSEIMNLISFTVSYQMVGRKNVLTTGLLLSSPMLVGSRLTSCILCFSIMWTKNFQMSKLHLEKTEEPEVKLPTLAGLLRKQGNSKKTFTSVSLTTQKPLTVWIIANCGKLLKRWDYQTILPVSWESCIRVKKQQLEPDMEDLFGSRLREEYERAVCCHCFV